MLFKIYSFKLNRNGTGTSWSSSNCDDGTMQEGYRYGQRGRSSGRILCQDRSVDQSRCNKFQPDERMVRGTEYFQTNRLDHTNAHHHSITTVPDIKFHQVEETFSSFNSTSRRRQRQRRSCDIPTQRLNVSPRPRDCVERQRDANQAFQDAIQRSIQQRLGILPDNNSMMDQQMSSLVNDSISSDHEFSDYEDEFENIPMDSDSDYSSDEFDLHYGSTILSKYVDEFNWSTIEQVDWCECEDFNPPVINYEHLSVSYEPLVINHYTSSIPVVHYPIEKTQKVIVFKFNIQIFVIPLPCKHRIPYVKQLVCGRKSRATFAVP